VIPFACNNIRASIHTLCPLITHCNYRKMKMSLSPQKVDFQSVWERLADGVSKLITLSNVKGMPLYEDIYKLCTAQPQPYSEQLYFHLKKHLEDHVEKIKQNVLSHQSDILAEYIKAWSSYSIGSQYCNIVFRYLNQYWIKKRREEAENKLGGHLYQGPASATEVYEINIVRSRTALSRFSRHCVPFSRSFRSSQFSNNDNTHALSPSLCLTTVSASHLEGTHIRGSQRLSHEAHLRVDS
jgi:hypothetical protein